ncbi:MAG: methylenetetrahydrofolate reductase [Acidimicrobiia bacterium]|nr:methylenetetrahydrofolate reductase [Acidimicrobiia bacterium]
MKVIEHLESADRPLISFEIIPPQRGGDLDSLLALIEDLAAHRPPFIDITSHAGQVVFQDTGGGYQRRIKRKRPGTLGICALVQNKFEIDAVPHVLCQGFTREETEDFLIELRYLGIDNVLALRGDPIGYDKVLDEGRSVNHFASDLVAQVAAMNRGRYLEELEDAAPTSFCVGVAGYPERHLESPNLATDIIRLREKVEAGAEYVVTQMFFDNAAYFSFVEACRAAGISVPIIPGIKIISSKRQLTSIPKTFHCEIPIELSDAISSAKDDHVTDIGVAWTVEQTRELLDHGVPSVHFYVMQSAGPATRVLEKLDV